MAYIDTIGRWGQGNIDLNNRIVVRNQDGTFSTERSFSTNIDGQEVLLPTIINGVVVSENDAVDHYLNTGEYLGKFNTVAAAEDYAQRLHVRQEWFYSMGAFNGKLIELKTNGSWVNFPLDYIAFESYSITPNQRMEAKANRATSGKLVRDTVEHTASKIEFNTPPITNKEVREIHNLLSAAFTNVRERKLEVRYYNTESDDYRTGQFYMPDTEYPIYRADLTTNTIYFKSLRFALIEY